jgi:hypothetical protein
MVVYSSPPLTSFRTNVAPKGLRIVWPASPRFTVQFQVGRQHDHLVENENLRVSETLMVQVHVQVHVLPFPAVQVHMSKSFVGRDKCGYLF